jgi:hypothetical protein
MKGISSALLSICCLVEIYLIGSNAHPTVFVLANEDQVQHAMPNKRAFDRLETSPFDFGAYSKRYSDDDSSFDFYRRKKSFDRLETSAFDFGYKRKRSFDGSAFDVVAKKRSVPSKCLFWPKNIFFICSG